MTFPFPRDTRLLINCTRYALNTLAAFTFGCPRSIHSRPAPVSSPSEQFDVANLTQTSVSEVDRVLEQTQALARQNGGELRLVWFRVSCTNVRGTIAQNCSGLTWSGTPVFGIPTPGLIPMTGFLSAEFQRQRADHTSEHLGITMFGTTPHTQHLSGSWEALDSGPRCQFSQALARAVVRGFTPNPGFKVVFEANLTPAQSTWTFVRDQTEVRVSDECLATADSKL